MTLLEQHEERRALVVVDVQNDFCEGGSLPVIGGAEVASKITKFIKKNAKKYTVIVATRDWHLDPGPHWSENPDYRDTWPVHCKANTLGADFHDNLSLDGIEEIFSKGFNVAAYSGFEGLNSNAISLNEYLQSLNITEVHGCGIATSHCVKATLLSAVDYFYKAVLLKSLAVGVTPELEAEALKELEAAGVEIR